MVAVTVLVVAGPAVARPGHVPHVPEAALTAAGTVALLVIAASGALLLVLLAFLSGRQRRSSQTPEVRAPKRATGDMSRRRMTPRKGLSSAGRQPGAGVVR
jgi:hypothetical protein